MDIWTVLKACLRRWYVFLPALLLASWFSWSQVQSIPPTYLATSSATVAGPALVPGGAPGEIVEVNPFERLGGSLTATGSVMVSVMNSAPRREAYVEEGVTAAYEVDQDDAVIYFDVTGDDPDEVLASAARLPELLDIELARLQGRAVEAPESRIRAVTLTVPTSADEDTVAGIRLLAVLLALGLVLAVALALVADALAQQLARRRAETDAPAGAAEAVNRTLRTLALRPRRAADDDASLLFDLGDEPGPDDAGRRPNAAALDPAAFGAAVGAAVGASVDDHEGRHTGAGHLPDPAEPLSPAGTARGRVRGD